MAALEVDLDTVKEGNTITVKWRGKPVFVKHRTDAEINRERAVPLADLRDPEEDSARCVDPKVSFVPFCCNRLQSQETCVCSQSTALIQCSRVIALFRCMRCATMMNIRRCADPTASVSSRFLC